MKQPVLSAPLVGTLPALLGRIYHTALLGRVHRLAPLERVHHTALVGRVAHAGGAVTVP